VVSSQTWSALAAILAGAPLALIPAPGIDRLPAACAALPAADPTPWRQPLLRGRRSPRSGWDQSHRGPVSPSPAELAVLADQLAALARAGLPTNRVWPILAERAATSSTRALAGAVAAGHVRGEGTARAIRRAIGSAEPADSTAVEASPGSGRSAGAAGGNAGRWRRGRRPDPAAARLAVAIDVSERTGAALAETLQRFADGLRADLEAEQERESAMAGPRTTAMILSVLPLAGLALGGLIGSHPWRTLFLTGPGRLCLLAGAAAWLGGRAWSAALIRRAAPRT
jgi:tight adherence protein B